MQKNKKAISLSVVIVLLVGLIINLYNNKNDSILKNEIINKKNNGMLTMMFESQEESGVYEADDSETSFDQDNYYFNPNLSGCEHGGSVSYANNKVTMESAYTDKCFVYFSTTEVSGEVENNSSNSEFTNALLSNEYFANYINNSSFNDESIIWHNGTTKDTSNNVLDAEDKSFRYAGPNYKVTSKAFNEGLTNVAKYSASDTDFVIGFYCSTGDSSSYIGAYCSGTYYYYVSYDVNNLNKQKTTLKEIEKIAYDDGYLEENVKNWVCFGYDRNSNDSTINESVCNSENFSPTSEYAYRVIGTFIDSTIYNEGLTNLTQEENKFTLLYYAIYYAKLTKNLIYTSGNSSSYSTIFNGTYLTNLVNNGWDNYITTTKWNSGTLTSGRCGDTNLSDLKTCYNSEMISEGPKYATTSKILKRYVSEIGYASNPSSWNTGSTLSYRNNWMVIEGPSLINGSLRWIGYEWTNSIQSNGPIMLGFGYSMAQNSSYVSGHVPTFSLGTNVKIVRGNGTISNPYILSL